VQYQQQMAVVNHEPLAAGAIAQPFAEFLGHLPSQWQ
jgi:hypothetical protein